MSNLRLIGLVIGVAGLALTFWVYRGPKWKKSNFVLSLFFNLLLISVCLRPDILNAFRDFLALKQAERGRILALLIGSNIFLLFFVLYAKARLDETRHQFDLLVRSLGMREMDEDPKMMERIRPIMVIIPAYDEAENLKGLLPRMPSEIRGIETGTMVVDDGSSDGTSDVAAAAGCLVVRNPINRGQGAASRLGYDILKKSGVRIGVTMDADNQHEPGDIEKLVVPVLEGRYDLVIGSRMAGGGVRGTLRRTGIVFFTLLINTMTGLKLTDCSSGLKAFNMARLSEVDLREDQFQAAEVIISAAKKGLRIGEVPVRALDRMCGESRKGGDILYGMHFFRSILRAWWR